MHAADLLELLRTRLELPVDVGVSPQQFLKDAQSALVLASCLPFLFLGAPLSYFLLHYTAELCSDVKQKKVEMDEMDEMDEIFARSPTRHDRISSPPQSAEASEDGSDHDSA
jgi:hypothetical protein